MGIFKRIEQRTMSFETEFGGSLSDGRKTFSGKKVSQETALAMTAVYACIGLISDGVASLPVDLYRFKGEDRREKITSPLWLKQPNPFMTPHDFWHKIVTSMAMDGNAFAYVLRDDRGVIRAMYPIAPSLVTIKEKEDSFGEPEYFDVNGIKVDPWNMLHIPLFTVAGRARGLSPLELHKEAIGLGLTAEEFGARFFSQGTTLAGVIQHPGSPKGDEVKILRSTFRKTHSGINNSHAVGILTGGATWQNISITPEQAQFLETRRFQNSQIALMYRVPAYMVDPTVTSTWGSGVEEQNKFFADYTLTPYVTRIEQAISRFLPGQQFIKFNMDARLRAKTSERFAAYKTAIEMGMLSIDEVRALEDMEPLPKGLGSKHYLPLNIGEIGKEPDPKADPVETPSEDAADSQPETPQEDSKDTNDEAV